MNADSSNSFWTSFMPHGQCYLWRPDILWLNVLSDGMIALAYFSIPLILIYFLRQRPNAPFRGLIGMFSAFILACGLTHLMGIWTVWHGTYGVQGILKGVTGLISIGTALMLLPIVPRLLAFSSPTDLEAINLKLQQEIAVHQETTARLHRTESRIRTYLDQSPDGIVSVAPSGNIRYANAMAATQFGYTPEQMSGMPIEGLVPQGQRNKHLGHRKGFFKNPHRRLMGIGMELSGQRADGSLFPVEISLSPVETADSEQVVLATIRDIADRKKLENETRKQLRELAHTSRINTVGEMATGLAHELNQPLTAISHNCDTAISIVREAKLPDPELIEILQENHDYSQRAGQIIRSLRQLVQKDRGDKELADLNALVRATADLIQPEARAMQVSVNLELADGLPLVAMSVTQIQQVLVNLERNGIEALSQINDHPRKMTIATETNDPNMVHVTVSDNGPGISAQIGEDLFKPHVSTRQEGMGLGLSICRSMVEAHGGKLWLVESGQGGATFRFTLPTNEGVAL